MTKPLEKAIIIEYGDILKKVSFLIENLIKKYTKYMPENKKSGVKKLFPAVVLVMSFYYSALFAIGLLLGYLATKFYCKKFGIDENSEKRIFLNLGKWDVHLHHWIMGVLLIIIIWIGGWRPEIPVFVWGLIIGMITHDIYDFNDWHQVIIKNENHKS